MSDYAVCPECGEKISTQKAEISNTYFFGYIKCPRCRKNLTAFHGEPNAFLKVSFAAKLLWMLCAAVFTVIDLCAEYINAWHFKEGVILCMITAFMILDIVFSHIHVYICKKRTKRARNGFLSFIYGVHRKKIITFAKETSISKCEIDGVNKYHAEVKLKKNGNSFEKVVILLPRTDISVKMSAAAKNLNFINLYDIYRVNNKDIFLQLSDYKIDEDIILDFKKVNSFGDNSNDFELFTLDGEFIGKASVI
ncbi:MAG: hypothetical protein NC120_06445 [Ruminococcus sp.]|nr:hypothetical protein [Ruminococcus sp.]